MAIGSIVVPDILKGASLFRSLLPVYEIGIQTYTTGSFMGSDPIAMFQELANIGFKNIETATYTNPYYGYTPKELRTIIEDLGMKWIGHHVLGVPINLLMGSSSENPETDQEKQSAQPEQNARSVNISPDIPNLTDNLQQLVDEAAEGGLQYLICASTAIGNIEEIISAIDVFTKAGEACRKASLQFAYHNHANEWDPVYGSTAYDIIMSQTDEDLVKMELDLGWVAAAKQDPIVLFRGYPGRFPLWHVKDFNLETNTIVPIGQGAVDFRPAFAHAEVAGMKYFFYEQDTAKSMDDVKASYDNLKNIL